MLCMRRVKAALVSYLSLKTKEVNLTNPNFKINEDKFRNRCRCGAQEILEIFPACLRLVRNNQRK
jgi:hypothetical protein